MMCIYVIVLTRWNFVVAFNYANEYIMMGTMYWNWSRAGEEGWVGEEKGGSSFGIC